MANQLPFTLWDIVEARGIPYANNSSDLYLPYSEEVRELLNDFPKQKELARQFINQTNQEVWLDIPFAYLPWWRERQREYDGM
jgi:hypothetical protein